MIQLIKLLRNLFPERLKLRIRLLRRSAADALTGRCGRFATTAQDTSFGKMRCVLEIRQPIREHELSAAKIHNIGIAVSRIRGAVIPPGKIFSFWRMVGNPGEEQGYRAGRALSDCRLGAETGGGLCQLAGIIYHLALLSGMEILERHAHSVDLYADDERYTPLGTDAAVKYGYKDLRFRNVSGGPVSLDFTLGAEELKARMMASRNLEPCAIDIAVTRTGSVVETRTRRAKPGSTEPELVAVSRYRTNDHHGG
ncbi:MAG TPA: VanW family protein [Spirochaetota bacterium]|nr:VanW family protein [Spirochaetota bacterium]